MPVPLWSELDWGALGIGIVFFISHMRPQWKGGVDQRGSFPVFHFHSFRRPLMYCPLILHSALRKTQHILSALSKMVPSRQSSAPITYYALDLAKRELERTLEELAASPVGREMEGKVDTRGLWGTYEGGIKFVKEGGLRSHGLAAWAASCDQGGPLSCDDGAVTQSSLTSSPLHILFLGSSLGNYPLGEAATLLRSLPLRTGKGDTLLLGLDHTSDPAKIEPAYNDRKGFSRRFILNGLKHAGRVMGDESMFAPEKWAYVSRYDAKERRFTFPSPGIVFREVLLGPIIQMLS